jgi:hypothetical protein
MTIAPRFFLAASICLLATASMLPNPLLTRTSQDDASRARSNDDHAGDIEARRIVDARVAPYSVVGRIKGTMVCTAAVVLHPRIALTAAHCVETGAGVVFQLGYQGGTDLGRFKATVWAIGAHQDFTGQSVHDASNDWAVLVLDRAPIGVQPFGLSELPADGLRQLGRQILMPSYGVDMAAAQVLSLDPACSIRKLAWNVLVHDCQTSSGGSGAPLLIKRKQGYEVVGIHTGAILERDEALQSVKLIGYEATGAWTFAEAIHELSAQLRRSGTFDVAGPLGH